MCSRKGGFCLEKLGERGTSQSLGGWQSSCVEESGGCAKEFLTFSKCKGS